MSTESTAAKLVKIKIMNAMGHETLELETEAAVSEIEKRIVANNYWLYVDSEPVTLETRLTGQKLTNLVENDIAKIRAAITNSTLGVTLSGALVGGV